MNGTPASYLDALHGEVRLDEHIAQLAATPEVQRLRHIRLSNIDSVTMPGIANISRYEHVLGVAHLASHIGLRRRIPQIDHLALMASALLHDWAITAFGHLVEEAFNYLSIKFDHEEKLHLLLHGNSNGDTLGAELQILAGRQAGLTQWARGVAGDARSAKLLERIGELIQGKGPNGRVISGDIDLDNIDNVYRMAYHMGLPVDRSVPLRLAEAIVDVGPSRLPIFAKSAVKDVDAWVQLRQAIYSRLMLARHDFSFKVMILFATTRLIKANKLTDAEWTLIDADFITKLLTSQEPGVSDTMARWKAGEAWDISHLWWLPGERPPYTQLATFSAEASDFIARPCFAYGIKDKRERRMDVHFDDGSSTSFGSKPAAWLFGVGSPKRGPFTRSELDRLISLAIERFAPDQRAVPAEDPMAVRREETLF